MAPKQMRKEILPVPLCEMKLEFRLTEKSRMPTPAPPRKSPTTVLTRVIR